ncbi:E3 ubiquitin-protein ligase PUB23 [Nymphaea colorata]|uniref:U-box domain-containing protein n=1 Tax=Nymphaea colorata TaxID=210225 RepID=A0A5K0V8Q8_9MAGN|nr:E3 ubiquitin-protein ligase PUB23 [Nymphaea colorata]
MEGVEVPPYFTCPISLQIMRDPVTISSGITYDRESMEKWVFSYKNRACPVTKLPISDLTMTPNHTLRRLIQHWCTENAALGVERIPTPKPPLDAATVLSLLNQADLPSLIRLRELASLSDRNKVCIRSAGAVKRLASFIHFLTQDAPSTPSGSGASTDGDRLPVIREALNLLCAVEVTEDEVKDLAAANVDLIASLAWVLDKGDCQSRVQACFLLKTAFNGLHPMFLMNVRSDLLAGIVRVLRDQISLPATKCAAQLLIEASKWGRNRIKVVDCGAVPALVEMLIETTERRMSEILMWLLDMLCGCAEGRAELLGHAAGIAVVSRKMMRVSQTTNDRAVRILYSLCRYSANPALAQEMLNIGAVSKLCLVLQVEGNNKTKEKAVEMLKMNARTWRNSSCVPHHLLSGYPSN